MNKKISFAGVICLGIVVYTLFLPVARSGIAATAQTLPDQDFVPGEVLVKFKSGAKNQDLGSTNGLGALSTSFGNGSITPFKKYKIEAINNTLSAESENLADLIKQNKKATLDAINTLKLNPDVEYAEPNYILKSSAYVPDDTQYLAGKLWGLNNTGQNGGTIDKDMNAPEAWNVVGITPGVKIAILDSGVDYTHNDLKNNIDLINSSQPLAVGNINGYNFCPTDDCSGVGNNNPQDNFGHGTHIAGIAAGTGKNGKGIIGGCPNCKIMPLKVINSAGAGTITSVTSGIYYAIDHGAKVINISLGAGGITSQSMHNAILQAVNSNIIVVASGGNCGDPSSYIANGCSYQNQPVFPASDENVIAVASMDRNGNRSSFSNVNSYISVIAPGSSILSTFPVGKNCGPATFTESGDSNSYYGDCSGTSMAAPYVSAGIGLMLTVNPNLNYRSVKNILQNTSKDLYTAGYDAQSGYGIINYKAAIDSSTAACDTLPTDKYCVEYYNNQGLSGYPTAVGSENGPTFNDYWGNSRPPQLMPNDNFSVRYIGKFNFITDKFVFNFTSNAGAYLYIDNMSVPAASYTGIGRQIVTRTITPGLHTIKLEFIGTNTNTYARLDTMYNNLAAPFDITDMPTFRGDISDIIPGDFNGDGKTDVIRQEKRLWIDGNRDTEVYLARGDGTFYPPIAITDSPSFRGDYVDIIPGDFNGDGKTDVIRQEKRGWVDGFRDTEVYLARGDGTFFNPIPISDQPTFRGDISDIIPGDFNGDGKTDVIRQEKRLWIDGNRDTEVYLARGDGTFYPPIAITDSPSFRGDYVDIIPGDFNGDGKTDVIRQEKRGWVDGFRDTEVYLARGDGTFFNPIPISDQPTFRGDISDIIPGDFNGDGKTDVIRQEKRDWIDQYKDADVYLSKGDGTFYPPVELVDQPTFRGDISDIIPGDFNGDGKTDVIRQEKRLWIDGVKDTQVYLSN